MTAVFGQSLRGHLRLRAAPDSRGLTVLREQSFQAPVHLSKPHHDAGALVINIASPTAGLFDGDEVDIAATVDPGAAVVLTTPAATRIHTARSGRPAVVRQQITVRPGGFAEYFPELLIPQRGARYRQQNVLQVEEGGTLLFMEWLAPGRVAAGETFAYAELRSDTDLRVAGRLVARERYSLVPDRSQPACLRTLHPAGHYVGCLAAGVNPPPHDEVAALNSADVYIGCGPLAAGGFTIRALCRDGPAARRTLHAIRNLLYRSLDRPAPSLGRF